MTSLDGKVAWITGGGKGIGRAIALALAARGVRVLVTGREEKALGYVVGEIANGGGKARHLVADVRDPAHAQNAIAKAIDTWGALDIVIANAAHAEIAFDLAAAESTLQTNLMGALYTFNAALPVMKSSGRLLAISRDTGSPSAASAASHAGLLALVRATAHALTPRAITCNAITITTPSIDPDRVASLALFLLAPSAPPLTAQTLSLP